MMKSFKEVYELGTDEYTKHTKDMTPGQSEGMSPAEKRAHAKAIADFKKRGGKVTKLPPGKAAGYHGKDDLGKDTFGKGSIKFDIKHIATYTAQEFYNNGQEAEICQ